MATPPFDLSRFRRIFSPLAQSQGSHGGWETENPPLPPYPLNPPFAPNMQPPPMLQGPPEQPPISLPQPPPPEPMVGQPQRTPQTPLNPPRMSPMTSSPRTIPQPGFPPPQGQSPLDFPPGGPQDPSQFDIGADIRKSMPPRPQMPTGEGLPNRPQQPESADYPYLGIGGKGTLGGPNFGETEEPQLGGPNWPEEPTPGLSRGGGGTGLRRPDELRPGTITNENMGDVPPYPEGMQRPSLDMGGYTNQMTDISDQAQANAPDEWFGQEGPQMPQSEGEQINQALSQWKPETAMQDRLNQLITDFPQRDQDMSKWRKFGSFVVGAGLGPEAQEKATYAPFYRQLGDWQAKLDPALKGAELEKQGNINLRQLLHNEGTEATANRRVDNQEQAERRRQQLADAKIDLDNRKLELANYRAKNPDAELVKSSDGYYHFLSQDGKDVATRVKHGELSGLEEAQWRRGDIQERGRVASEKDQGNWHQYDDYSDGTGTPVKRAWNDKTKETITLSGGNTPPQAQPPTSAPPAQGGMAPPTQPTPPAQAPAQAPPQAVTPPVAAQGKPPTQADQQKGLETQVARAKHEFPEFEDYINWDETTQLPDITKPKHDYMGFGSGWTPYTQEKYEEIKRYVFGSNPKKESGPASTGGNTRTTSRGTTVTRID